MNFAVLKGHSSVLKKNSPDPLQKYMLAHSQSEYLSFEEGTLLSQTIPVTGYVFSMHYIFINKEVFLNCSPKKNILVLNYMLEGTVEYSLTGYGQLTLEQGNYQLFYLPGGKLNQTKLTPGNYCLVQIEFSSGHLKNAVMEYPFFETLYAAEKNSEKANVHQSAQVVPFMNRLINEVVFYTKGLFESRLLIESRIRDLLRLFIEGLTEKADYKQVSTAQWKVLMEAEDYILGHLDGDVSVKKLTMVTGVARSVLQRICKQFKHKGIHHWVIDLRMKEAARLLMTTDLQISQISVQVSSGTISGFSAAFTKYFKEGPKKYRENKSRKRHFDTDDFDSPNNNPD